MATALILFGAAMALELLAHLFGASRLVRRSLAAAALAGGSFAAGVLIMTSFNLFSSLIVLLSLYRALNMIRIVKERMHEQYLKRATRRTSFVLIGLQLAVFAGWAAWYHWHVTGFAVWSIVGILHVVGAFLLLVSLLRSLRRTEWPTHLRHHYSDKELPSVTVAIPARNETEDLQECLQSIIASDYPKLEVLVLDDCSQLKRTPEIIKEFAHAGVRFIQGHEPRDTWLPKNQAYDRLVHEATGKYVLFCGVDIRFSPGSVRNIITVALSRDKKMINLLPPRKQGAYGRFSFIQAMRYWWELVPPRRLFNCPPVLSSCWLIEKDALHNAGGFAAVARSVVPEAHFARKLIQTDSYSFLRSNTVLGIESSKSVSNQRETAIRMRYPQMHRRPEQTVITVLLEGFFLLFPVVLVPAGFWISIGVVAHVLAACACALLIAVYALVATYTRVNTWWFSLLAQPLAVAADIALLHYSMWQYEFSAVEWKGRNICIPAMHVVPRLPDTE